MKALLVCLILGFALAAPLLADSAQLGGRRITINGRPLNAADAVTLARLEQQTGRRAPDGSYWYDSQTGATGQWGGPTVGFLPAGLRLGGPLPPNASGGGAGQLTAVFINGREIHPTDLAGLSSLVGPIQPGRYWVDAMGNAGLEGGPTLVNLMVLMQQQSKGKNGRYTRGKHWGDGTYVSNGCTAVNGHTGPSSDSATYSYFVGCE